MYIHARRNMLSAPPILMHLNSGRLNNRLERTAVMLRKKMKARLGLI